MKKLLYITLLFPTLFYAQVTTGKITLPENAVLSWEITAFDEKEHTIDICKSDFDYICTIDGQLWYGSDMGMDKPKNQLTKLTLSIGGKVVKLETSYMFNPNFGGKLGEHQFKLVKEGGEYRLYAFFSDGAGTYTAHWRIADGAAVRELISTDETYFEWQE